MSELPISSPYRSTPDAPVTESERDQLSTRLNAAFTEGSLDADEYQQRLDQLFGAARLGELVPVVQGLPPLQTYANPAIVASSGGQPGQLTTSKDSRAATLVVLAVVIGLAVLITVLILLLI